MQNPTELSENLHYGKRVTLRLRPAGAMPSMKSRVFMDGSSFFHFPSTFSAVFVDGNKFSVQQLAAKAQGGHEAKHKKRQHHC